MMQWVMVSVRDLMGLCDMLGSPSPDKKRNRKDHVGESVQAYSCTIHESTGESSFAPMFGREPHLSIDIAFVCAETTNDGLCFKYMTDCCSIRAYRSCKKVNICQ